MLKRQLPWAIALACLVLGFMLSMQFKVQKQVALNTTGYQRAQELAAQLRKAEQDRDQLGTEVEGLRGQLRSMASNQAQFKDLAQQLEQAQVNAGLIPLTGRGVTVVMTDSTRPVTPGENSANFIIHDEDVLKTVNDLAASGAEAISINGQRLIGRSEIRCAGPTITINGVRTAPPIIITAVGDPDLLESSINMRGGVGEQLRPFGIQVTAEKKNQVTVPAFKGSLKLQFGTPVTQEVTKP
jgi:uncharacterized protein YlxW (UPF0749 family)